MSDHRWPPRSDEEYRQEVLGLIGLELVSRFETVEAVVLDADGILTGGNLLYGPGGEAFKEFHSRDGLGLVLARFAGIRLGLLTGRQSETAGRRARELRFDSIKLGRFDKLVALGEIVAETGVPARRTLYMGDDLLDLPPLYEVGVPVTVPEAPEELRRHCCYVTSLPGGQGAVREVLDLVLKVRGLFGPALAKVARRAWGQEREEPR